MSRILVTGASGFVGQHVCHFLSKSFEVVGVGRRPLNGDGYTYIQADLLDLNISKFLDDHSISTIIHLASVQPSRIKHFEDVAKSNIILTERLMVAAEKVKTIIFASSMNVYGVPKMLPVTENSPLSVTTDNDYTLSKVIAETIVQRNLHSHQRALILRLASIFGLGHDDGIAYFIYSSLIKNEEMELYSKGETLKELIHVDDVCQTIAAYLGSTLEGLTTLNLGYGEKISMANMVTSMKKQLGSTSDIILSEKVSNRNYDFYFDSSSLKETLSLELPALSKRLSQYCSELASVTSHSH